MSEHGSEHGSDESFEDAFGSGGALHVALVDAFTLEGTKHIPEITRSLTESPRRARREGARARLGEERPPLSAEGR